MPKFSLLTATRTIEHAMPFVLYRLAVHLGLAVTYLVAVLAGAGTFIAFASFTRNPSSVANIGGIVGLAGCAYLVYKFRGTIFFNVNAGQLALLGEEAKGGKLPEGKAQIDFARQTAAASLTPALFDEISQTEAVVASELGREFASSLGQGQYPLLQKGLKWIAGLVAASATQAFMIHHFRGSNSNPWQAAELGLLQLSHHFKTLFRFEVYSIAFEYGGLLVAFIALLYPIDSIASSLPIDVGGWRQVFALIFAWSIKSAFFSPIGTTAMAHALLSLPGLTDMEHADLRANLSQRVPAFATIQSSAVKI